MEAFCTILAFHIGVLQLFPPPVVRMTIRENCAYVSSVGQLKTSPTRTSGGGDLWIERTDLSKAGNLKPLRYYGMIFGRENALLRWQLVGGWYYCVAYNWGSGEAISRSGWLEVGPLSAIEHANAQSGNADFDWVRYRWAFGNRFVQGPHFSEVMDTAFKPASIVQQVYFDFWCRGDKKFEVYVTEPHRAHRLRRNDYLSERERSPEARDNPGARWKTAGEWTFDWTGPFYVTATGDERFFVTDSGRVYSPPKDAKPGALLKELWKGAPVDVLIHDSDRKKWYAFTKDQYFEVADPIKPKPHALAIRRSWFAEPALETAAKCGRVIRGLPEPK